jgi:hypothetical protein
MQGHGCWAGRKLVEPIDYSIGTCLLEELIATQRWRIRGPRYAFPTMK